MEKKIPEKLEAEWLAMQNVARFQNMLKTETDEGRYNLLTQLLADEFEKLKKTPGP